MARKPAGLKPNTRICCLTGKAEWTSPPRGQACTSRRHGHMNLDRVEGLVAEERLEWVAGQQVVKGKVVDVWIPVVRFVVARHWRKTMSKGLGAAVAVMQLVS